MDTSTLTACANDYGYKYVFSRPLKALATEKDILIVISTSGNSGNIINALKRSQKKGSFHNRFFRIRRRESKKAL